MNIPFNRPEHMVKSKVCEVGVSGLPTHSTSKLHGRQDVWSLRRRMWMVSPSQPTILSMWNDTVSCLHLFRPKPWGLWMREKTDFCVVLPSFPLGGEAMGARGSLRQGFVPQERNPEIMTRPLYRSSWPIWPCSSLEKGRKTFVLENDEILSEQRRQKTYTPASKQILPDQVRWHLSRGLYL